MTKMPVIFSGHGDPMIALRDDELTRKMREVGDKVIERHGKPKAILAISAHWYGRGIRVQSAAKPRQVYDMYGFPEALYNLKYPVDGCKDLTDRVIQLVKGAVVDDTWGIDHGTWTILCNMFPEADIPVVQLSVSSDLSPEECYNVGEMLAPLREEGYLIFGSGNVVHNLRLVDWNSNRGTTQAETFNSAIINLVESRDDKGVIDFESLPYWDYAVPTPEHFLPLLYCLGASKGTRPEVFNNVCNLGSMAMTGFRFGS